MSKLTEQLPIEVIGEALILDPIMPDTRSEKTMKDKMKMKVVDAPDPKNKYWEDSTKRHKITDFDEHPFQGIVKGISPLLKDRNDKIGSIKINDRIAIRVGAGEPVVFKDKTYVRVAPHEIMFKYQGQER
jgi:hypothetical protein